VTQIYLRRGLAAGLCAGLLAGLFAFLAGEPLLDNAIALEGHGGHEVFSRGEQKAGLFLATGLYGSAMGLAFGLVFALLFRDERDLSRSGLRLSFALAAVAFLGASLMPFLKYPPNPPGAVVQGGSPGTAAYLGMVVLSLLALLFARRLWVRFGDVGHARRTAPVIAFLVCELALLHALLPAAGPVTGVPEGLLWGFRLASLGTQAVLWLGIGLLFGLLGERGGAGPLKAAR
jgi:hypothetical protein